MRLRTTQVACEFEEPSSREVRRTVLLALAGRGLTALAAGGLFLRRRATLR